MEVLGVHPEALDAVPASIQEVLVTRGRPIPPPPSQEEPAGGIARLRIAPYELGPVEVG